MKTSSVSLETLGGKWFLHSTSLAIVVPYLVIVSVLSGVIQIVGVEGTIPNAPGTIWLLVVANLLSLAACWLLLELLNLTLLRNKQEKPLNLMLVAAISFGVGAFKGHTTGVFGYALGAFPSLDLATGGRWLQTGILGLIMIPALTLTVAKISSLDEERGLIVAERVAAMLREPSNNDVVQADRIEKLKVVLTNAIQELELRIKTKPAQAQRMLEATIASLIDGHVRPLSHELWKEQQRLVPRITPGLLLLAGIKALRPNAWLLGLLIFVPLLMGQMVTSEPASATARTLLTLTGIVTLTLVASAVTRWFPVIASFAHPIGLLFGTFLGIVLADLVLGPLESVNIILSGVLIYLLALQCAIYISFGAMVFAKERELESELVALLGTDRIEAEARRYLAGHSSRSFAQFLHSDVQNSLLASALAVRQAENEGEDFELKLDRLRAVVSSLGVNRQPLDSPTLIAIADELHFQWDGFVNLEIAGDLALQFSSQASANALLEALNEAISNALRHGLATSISINLEASSKNSRKLLVEVKDDGVGPRRGGPGLGSSLLDIISNGSWTLSGQAKGGSVLAFEFEH